MSMPAAPDQTPGSTSPYASLASAAEALQRQLLLQAPELRWKSPLHFYLALNQESADICLCVYKLLLVSDNLLLCRATANDRVHEEPTICKCLSAMRSLWICTFCQSYVKQFVKVIFCRHVPETLEEPIKAALVVYVIPANTGLSAALQACCACAPLLAACLPPDDDLIPSVPERPPADMERCVGFLKCRPALPKSTCE